MLRNSSYRCSRKGKGSGDCPYCYANVRGRSAYRGHRGYYAYRAPFVSYWREYMKKPTAPVASPDADTAAVDPRFAKDYPVLWMYMTDLKWDDGTPRVPSSISLFVEDGVVKVAVADKDLKRSLYVAGESVQAALRAAEKALAGSSTDWKKWGASTRKKG